MILITFIGTGAYEQSKYQYRGVNTQGIFIWEALLNITSDIDEIIVLYTQTSAQSANFSSYQQLKKQFSAINFTEMLIDENTDILEGTAKAMSKLLKNKTEAEIIIDITHFYRHLPYYISDIIDYHGQLNPGIKLIDVVYGNMQQHEIVSMLDSRILQALIISISGVKAYANFKGLISELDRLINYYDHSAISSKIKQFRNQINELDANLKVMNIKAFMDHCAQLQKIDLKLTTNKFIDQTIIELLQSIQAFLKKFALPISEKELTTGVILKQLELAMYLIEMKQLTPINLYLRELIVNILMYTNGEKIYLNKKNREIYENTLGLLKAQQQNPDFKSDRPLLSVDAINEIKANPDLALWLEIMEYRNPIAHCGMNQSVPAMLAHKWDNLFVKYANYLQRIIDQIKLGGLE